MAFPLGSHPPPFLVPKVGMSPSLMVCLAVSPQVFWVQYSSMANFYSDQEESMTNFYEDESKLVVMQEEELKEGALLAVKGSGRWRRGRIICKGSVECVVQIRLVDSGHLLLLPPWQAGQGRLDLQPINKRFCKLPTGAMQAKLSGVSPRHSIWSGAAREWWEGTVLSKCFDCQVVNVIQVPGRENASVIEVELFEVREEGERHIGMEMIEIGFAALK